MAWIRSQNGKILIDASMIYVGEPHAGKCELSACIGSDWDRPSRVMGAFPTQRQVVEELNKIQIWIKESIPAGIWTRTDVYQITPVPTGQPKGEPEPC